MKLLFDNNLTPGAAKILARMGIEAEHVRQLDLHKASDAELIAFAASNDCILVTADNDFPQILALSGAPKPSVILLVGQYPSRPEQLAIFLANQMERIRPELASGAIVSIGPTRTRSRRIPLKS